MQVKVKKLHPDAIMPKYATDGSACFDLHALGEWDLEGYGFVHAVELGEPKTFKTGLSFEVPTGHVMLVFSRSGHGFKHSTRLSNCVGVIDADYRGELMVSLTRDCSERDLVQVKAGDRIAQAMIIPIPSVELVEAEELTNTERGTGGFGSTGA